MLIWLALALVTFSLWIYLSPPDVDPLFVHQQGQFAQIRRPNETAACRSPVNPWGGPLCGSGLKFHLRDLSSEKLKVELVQGPVISSESVDIDGLVQQYLPSLKALAMNGQKVLVAIPESPRSLAVLISCALAGLVPYFCLPSDLEAAVTKLHPGTVIVGSKQPLGDIDLKDAIPVSLDTDSEDILPLTSFKGGSPPPSPRPVEAAFGFFIEGKAYSFTHYELGAAIAAQLKSLGPNERWSGKVLNFSLYTSPFSLLMALVALSAKCTLVYINHSFTDPFAAVEHVEPEVVVTDDLSVRSLCRKTDDFRAVGFLQLQFRYLLQQKGRLWSALLPEFKKVRLVYSCAVSERHGALTGNEMRTARALMGAQLLHSLCTPTRLSPLAQTTFGDYRTSTSVINFGPPVPGHELKVVETTNAKPKFGKLAIGDGHSWTTTDLDAYLERDGCVYVDAPPPDEIDIYTEHLGPSVPGH